MFRRRISLLVGWFSIIFMQQSRKFSLKIRFNPNIVYVDCAKMA